MPLGFAFAFDVYTKALREFNIMFFFDFLRLLKQILAPAARVSVWMGSTYGQWSCMWQLWADT